MEKVNSEKTPITESRSVDKPQPAACNPRFYRLGHLVRTKNGEGLLGGISGPTVWRWIKQGTFPKPVSLGPNTTAFCARAVDAWINSKISGNATS
jgi:predicted DNA-binding transcriptional regulator AlpA